MVVPRNGPQRIERLTPLVDILDRIDRQVDPVSPRPMAIEAAAGHPLAEDVVAAAARPSAPVALCDGWAVSSEQTVDAGPFAPVAISAVPIRSGQPLPPQADAVASVEAVVARGDTAEAVAPVAPGDGVLAIGIDAGRHEILARAGERLRVTDVAAMAALGVSTVAVRAPRVRIVPARGEDPIIAAIGGLFGRMLQGAGASPSQAPSSRGPNALAAILREKDADAFVVVGGSGSGADDASVHALSACGRIEAHGIAVSPGESSALGFVDRIPVLVVPGRLDAALAVWLTVGRRLVDRLGDASDENETAHAKLSRKVTSSLGLAEVVPVRRDAEGFAPLASGYLPLQSLIAAHGWILVPADSEGYPAGANVAVRPLP
jgi:molybdopterin molybdotransferase